MNSTTNKTSAPVINKLAAPAKSREKKADLSGLLSKALDYRGLAELIPALEGTSNLAASSAIGAGLSEIIGRNAGAIAAKNPKKMLAARVAAGLASGGVGGGVGALASPLLSRNVSGGTAAKYLAGATAAGMLGEAATSSPVIGALSSGLGKAKNLAGSGVEFFGTSDSGGGLVGSLLQSPMQRASAGALTGSLVSEGSRKLLGKFKTDLAKSVSGYTDEFIKTIASDGKLPSRKQTEELMNRFSAAGIKPGKIPTGVYDAAGNVTDPDKLSKFLHSLSAKAGRYESRAEALASSIGLLASTGMGGLEGLAGGAAGRLAEGNLQADYLERLKRLAAGVAVGTGGEAVLNAALSPAVAEGADKLAPSLLNRLLAPLSGATAATVGANYLTPIVTQKAYKGLPKGSLAAALGASSMAAGSPVIGSLGLLSAPFINPDSSKYMREGLEYLKERRAVSDLTKNSSYRYNKLSAPIKTSRGSLEKAAFLRHLGRHFGAVGETFNAARAARSAHQFIREAPELAGVFTRTIEPVISTAGSAGTRPRWYNPIRSFREGAQQAQLEKEFIRQNRGTLGVPEPDLRRRAAQYAQQELDQLNPYMHSETLRNTAINDIRGSQIGASPGDTVDAALADRQGTVGASQTAFDSAQQTRDAALRTRFNAQFGRLYPDLADADAAFARYRANPAEFRFSSVTGTRGGYTVPTSNRIDAGRVGDVAFAPEIETATVTERNAIETARANLTARQQAAQEAQARVRELEARQRALDARLRGVSRLSPGGGAGNRVEYGALQRERISQLDDAAGELQTVFNQPITNTPRDLNSRAKSLNEINTRYGLDIPPLASPTTTIDQVAAYEKQLDRALKTQRSFSSQLRGMNEAQRTAFINELNSLAAEAAHPSSPYTVEQVTNSIVSRLSNSGSGRLRVSPESREHIKQLVDHARTSGDSSGITKLFNNTSLETDVLTRASARTNETANELTRANSAFNRAQTQVTRAETEVSNAETAYNNARINLEYAIRTGDEHGITSAQAVLETAERDLGTAQTDLNVATQSRDSLQRSIEAVEGMNTRPTGTASRLAPPLTRTDNQLPASLTQGGGVEAVAPYSEASIPGADQYMTEGSFEALRRMARDPLTYLGAGSTAFGTGALLTGAALGTGGILPLGAGLASLGAAFYRGFGRSSATNLLNDITALRGVPEGIAEIISAGSRTNIGGANLRKILSNAGIDRAFSRSVDGAVMGAASSSGVAPGQLETVTSALRETVLSGGATQQRLTEALVRQGYEAPQAEQIASRIITSNGNSLAEISEQVTQRYSTLNSELIRNSSRINQQMSAELAAEVESAGTLLNRSRIAKDAERLGLPEQDLRETARMVSQVVNTLGAESPMARSLITAYREATSGANATSRAVSDLRSGLSSFIRGERVELGIAGSNRTLTLAPSVETTTRLGPQFQVSTAQRGQLDAAFNPAALFESNTQAGQVLQSSMDPPLFNQLRTLNANNPELVAKLMGGQADVMSLSAREIDQLVPGFGQGVVNNLTRSGLSQTAQRYVEESVTTGRNLAENIKSAETALKDAKEALRKADSIKDRGKKAAAQTRARDEIVRNTQRLDDLRAARTYYNSQVRAQEATIADRFINPIREARVRASTEILPQTGTVRSVEYGMGGNAIDFSAEEIGQIRGAYNSGVTRDNLISSIASQTNMDLAMTERLLVERGAIPPAQSPSYLQAPVAEGAAPGGLMQYAAPVGVAGVGGGAVYYGSQPNRSPYYAPAQQVPPGMMPRSSFGVSALTAPVVGMHKVASTNLSLIAAPVYRR